ncbi:MAG: acyl-CoA/acyl-ACP dehydrogenase [Leptolyngbya sp. SIO1D8]|nr:acyl-CoA/acyl-ACP dehydrogenase [Leptolyngbya sp. SIO1D8]
MIAAKNPPISTNEILQKIQSVLDELATESSSLFQKPFSKEHWMRLIDAGIMMSCIPSEYGGMLSTVTTFKLLSKLSYFALPLSLRVMIIQLLFTSILVKHGNSETQREIFPKLMSGDIGGIAITEPNYGSDALNMQTGYHNTSQGYVVSGTKHWQGLSGETEWFLIAAREIKENQKAAGNIDFFLHEMKLGGMEVIEKYPTPGLLMMQYGKNKIDVNIPHHRKMIFPSGKRNPLLMDVFNTARLAFPAMGLGFLERIYEEAQAYTHSRQINRKPLSEYDLAQFRVEHLKIWRDLCLMLFEHSQQTIDVYTSVADETLLADVYKVVVSDLMLKASHSLQQLHGGMGYRQFGFPERAFADSRPFQILDGSNDILWVQIAWLVMKAMRLSQAHDFRDFLGSFEPTRLVSQDLVEDYPIINPDYEMPQRQLLKLGQFLAKAIALNCIKEVQESHLLTEDDINEITLLLNFEMKTILLSMSSGCRGL